MNVVEVYKPCSKLESEKRERDLITPATLADVKEYDPKIRRLLTIIQIIVGLALILGVLKRPKSKPKETADDK